MPFEPATSTVPRLPTGFASTVTPLAAAPDAAADAAGDAGATEAGACVAGVWVAAAGDEPVELHAATTATTRRGAARARKRMGMSVGRSADRLVGRAVPDVRRYVAGPRRGFGRQGNETFTDRCRTACTA